MRVFKDGAGRDWSIELTVLSFKKTRGEFGDLLDPEYFLTKIEDSVFCSDLIFALVADQAETKGVSLETFESSMRGDALETARRTLVEEYVDFFPSKASAAMKEALKRIDELKEKAMKSWSASVANLGASETAGAEESSN